MGGGDNSDPPIGSTTDNGGSSERNEEDEDPRQTGIDEHVPDEDPENTEEEEDSGPDPVAPPVGGAGGGTPGTVPPSAESHPPEEQDDQESDSEQPEECDSEQLEPELPDEEPDSDDIDDNTEAEGDDSSEDEQTEDEPDEDEEDDDDQEAKVIIRSDAWDDVGWGLYPIRYELEERYGDQIEIVDQLVPVREFESPQEIAHEWESNARRHRMPVDNAIWNVNPPGSTELTNRAFLAARRQSVTLAMEYLRRLRIAALVERTNVEDPDVVLELAREIGLDVDQLEESLHEVSVHRTGRSVETPKTIIEVDGTTITQSGYLHIDDLKMIFEQAGLEEERPRPLSDFVLEYGPVTPTEVAQVYDLDRDQAIETLREENGIFPVEYGNSTFWAAERSSNGL